VGHSIRFEGEFAHEVIVRFTSYKYAVEHHIALRNSMLQLDGWEWIERVNPASAFPTDFALLRIEEREMDNVINQLKSIAFVKDISRQSRFTRALLQDDEIARDPSFGQEIDDFSGKSVEHKSRGKRSMPWSEDGDLPGHCEKPSLLDTGRKILMQVNISIYFARFMHIYFTCCNCFMHV
jgi:membrane-bound transcription factor site-1 protease